MKKCINIKNKILLKAFLLAITSFWLPLHSFALDVDYSSYCGFLADKKTSTEMKENFDTDTTKEKVKKVNQIEEKVKDFCKKLEDASNSEIYRQQNFFTYEVEDIDAYNTRFNAILEKNPSLKRELAILKVKYEQATKELDEARAADVDAHEKAKASGEYQPCGPQYPRGCPDGKKCFKYRDASAYSGFQTYNTSLEITYAYKCLEPDSREAKKNKYTPVLNGENTDEIKLYTSSAYSFLDSRTTITETGEVTVEYLKKENGCNIEAMRVQYQSKCYSCVIIRTLMETFLNACSKAYDITSEAGVKLLVFGALIWMAFFVMKNVSSLSNVEPGAMMNTLMTFLFKVMVAYILITSGLGVLVKYTINPILTAGADMGIAFINATSDVSGANGLESRYAVHTPTITDGGTTTEIVSSDVMNRVMQFAQDLDKNVSLNLVIGHSITCWSITGGAWDFHYFRTVNLWLWFCGALIWFVGFMLTLGIGYYLLDISFKLGFAIMALPVVIGLWPFNITKGKVSAVISIILKAAGTFVFLALTTTYALVMISIALRDTDTLLDKVKDGEAEWISETFAPTGPYFLIILFAYLYSMKLISSTVSDYVEKFFKDGVFGSADPMHGKLTQITDMTKQLGMMPVKWAGGKIGDAAKEKAKEGAVRTGRFVKGLFKGKANGDQEKNSKGGRNPLSGGGAALKNSGKGLKSAGATTEQTGKGVKAAGKGMQAGGKAAQAGGKGMMNAGKALSSTGLGAIVGVPMMLAGGVTYAAGKGAEIAGKATQKVGSAMQKGGKAMKKTGEKIEKAGEKMQKVGKRLQVGDQNDSSPKEENSSENQNENNSDQNQENRK